MYNLPYYKEKNPEVIKEFIDQHPFAFLSGCDHENKPVATQVPVFIEEHNGRKVLRGHIMKNTDHHKAFLHNNNVLAVFTGHHTYVSGTWYSNPYTASTWNYMSVHIKGNIRFLETSELKDVLRKTTLHSKAPGPAAREHGRASIVCDPRPGDTGAGSAEYTPGEAMGVPAASRCGPPGR